MKMKSLVRLVTLCSLVQIAPLVLAQNPDEADGVGPRGRQKLASLSPAEREQLRSAHAKAMQDPAVIAAEVKMRQARREYREAMRAALLKADPAIQPVLIKIPQAHGRRNS
jgi:Spy/CpxP family protein refolding chaperone